MATEGKIPTLGFGAGAIKFVVLMGFSASTATTFPADMYETSVTHSATERTVVFSGASYTATFGGSARTVTFDE